MIKKIFPVFSIFLILIFLVSFFSVTASAYEISGFDVRAEGALLYSIDTDAVIYSKNADKKLYPASLTKIMTAVIILENTEDIDNEIITVSHSALVAIMGTGSTVMGLLEGEQITAHQLLCGLLMSSGGDAAYVAAEYYGGSTAGFVEKMNSKAAELGMTGTQFCNPHGLHDDDHYTTANDLLKLTKYALTFDTFKDIVSHSRYKMAATNLHAARTIVTTNFLIDASTAYYYKPVKGIKTGYTDKAGRCLITTAEKNGYSYICILLNSPAKDENGGTVRYEFTDSKSLYEWAFNNFEYKAVGNNTLPVCEMPVKLSFNADYVTLVMEKEVSTMLPKLADDSTIKITPHLFKKSVKAPVKKGDVLGTADIVYAEEVLATVNLVAANDIEPSTTLSILDKAKSFFTSRGFMTVFLIICMIVVLFLMYCVYLNRARISKKRHVVYKPLKKDEKNRH